MTAERASARNSCNRRVSCAGVMGRLILLQKMKPQPTPNENHRGHRGRGEFKNNQPQRTPIRLAIAAGSLGQAPEAQGHPHKRYGIMSAAGVGQQRRASNKEMNQDKQKF